MADPDDILKQYGPDPLPYPEQQPGYTPVAHTARGITAAGADSFAPSNDGTLFRIGEHGDLQFKPWESIKSFMSYRAPPGALSTSGDDQPIRDAFDTAGWISTSGLGLNYAGMVPANSVGVFGGRLGAQNLAKQGIHAPEKAIAMAERMKAEGATPAEIWQATGRLMEKEDPRFSAVHHGQDGMPRFEIPDNQSSWTPRMMDEWEMRNFIEGRPGETLQHPLLHAAYPQMKEIPMDAGARAGFAKEGEFWHWPEGGAPSEGSMKARGKNPEDLRKVALHELQHGAQRFEGHARGSSPGSAPWVIDEANPEIQRLIHDRDRLWQMMEQEPPDSEYGMKLFTEKLRLEDILREKSMNEGYRRSAGEVEARNVEKRARMTPEQLRARPPWETQDVPSTQQILQMYEQPVKPR